MDLITFLVVANFFVKFHIVEDGIHTYTLLGVQNESIDDAGVEYYITYTGAKLPVDDSKKFYARIEAECMTVEAPAEMVPDMMKRSRVCVAKSISY